MKVKKFDEVTLREVLVCSAEKYGWSCAEKDKAIEVLLRLKEREFFYDVVAYFCSRAPGLSDTSGKLVIGGVEIFNSVYIHEANFVFCRVYGVDFALVQYRNFFDGIFFIEGSIFLGANTSSVVTRVEYLFSAINDRKVARKFGVCFDGFWASQKLPYHFFYDVFPAAVLAIKNAGLSRLNLFRLERGGFLDFAEIFPEACSYEVFSGAKYDDSFLRFALLKPRVSKSEIQKIDRDFSSLVNLKDCDRLWDEYVWVGVLAGKRELVNQVEIISNFIKLAKEELGGNVFFFFDGLTRSIDESFLSSVRHEKILGDIILSSGLERGSYNILHGKSAIEKIAAARKLNFYLSEAGTASMYPSRFGSSAGVVYGKDKSHYKGHFHTRSVFVGSELKEPPERSAWDYQNINIDTDRFIEICTKCLRNDLQ